MRSALDWLYRITGWMAGAFLLAIFALMMVMSVGRQVGVNVPAGDDLVSWCMAACAFLGLAHTFKSGEMIRVELVCDLVRGKARHVLELVSLTVGVVLVGYFAYYAVQLTYDSWRFNDMAQGVLPIPLWIPQTGYAFGLVVLAVAFVEELVRVAAGHAPGYEKPAPKTAEEVVERAIQSGV